MTRLFLAFLALALFSACQSKTDSDEVVDTKMRIKIKETLRQEPGLDGAAISQLNPNESVDFAGEISDFSERLLINDELLEEPWVKIKTTKGQEGWIFAACLEIDSLQNPKLVEKLQVYRERAILGPKIHDALIQFRADADKCKSDEDFAKLYRSADSLRNQLDEWLSLRSTPDLEGKLPNYYWLNKAIPGQEVLLVAEGTVYAMFFNYGYWAELSKRTKGTRDDNFSAFCITLFPDSIEYYYPAWYLQTWDYGGTSLLGKGIHLDILTKMDKLYQDKLFIPEVQQYKVSIMDDMLQSEFYELGVKEVCTELEQIITAKPGILQASDIEGLKGRLTELKSGNSKVNFDSFGGG